MNNDEYITTKIIMAITTLGRTKLYEMIKNGEFPKEDRQTGKEKYWKASSVYNWMQQKAKERNQ